MLLIRFIKLALTLAGVIIPYVYFMFSQESSSYFISVAVLFLVLIIEVIEKNVLHGMREFVSITYFLFSLLLLTFLTDLWIIEKVNEDSKLDFMIVLHSNFHSLTKAEIEFKNSTLTYVIFGLIIIPKIMFYASSLWNEENDSKEGVEEYE